MKYLLLAILSASALYADIPGRDLHKAIHQARPGANWTCGETYESIVWLDTEHTKPSLAELEEAYEVVKAKADIPVSVTKRQLRLELLSRGLLAQVVPAIQAALDGDAETAALIEWEDASVFERAHPLVTIIGQILNQSPAQMDAIWRAAAAR